MTKHSKKKNSPPFAKNPFLVVFVIGIVILIFSFQSNSLLSPRGEFILSGKGNILAGPSGNPSVSVPTSKPTSICLKNLACSPSLCTGSNNKKGICSTNPVSKLCECDTDLPQFHLACDRTLQACVVKSGPGVDECTKIGKFPPCVLETKSKPNPTSSIPTCIMQLGPEIRLTSAKGSDTQPFVLVDSKKNIHVVYAEQGKIGRYGRYNLIHNIYDQSTQLIKSTTLDSTKEVGFIYGAKFDSSENIHIVYTDSLINNANKISYVKVDSSGNILIPPKIVVQSGSTYQRLIHTGRIDVESGNAYITWHEGGGGRGSKIYYIKVDNKGNVGSEILLDQTLPREKIHIEHPSIAVDKSGATHIFWIKRSGFAPDYNALIRYAQVDGNGKIIIGPKDVQLYSTSNQPILLTELPHPVHTADIFIDSTQRIHLIVYFLDENHNTYSIRTQILNSKNGDPITFIQESVPTKYVSISHREVAIDNNKGHSHLYDFIDQSEKIKPFYAGGDNVYLVSYDINGNKVISKTKISTSSDYKHFLNQGTQYYSSAEYSYSTTDKDGGMYIVWSDNRHEFVGNNLNTPSGYKEEIYLRKTTCIFP